MTYEGIVFALITAVSFGFWTVFHQQASPHINPIFGAIVVSLTAVVLGSIILLPQIKEVTLFTSQKGVIFVILAWLAAFAIDFFALKTYASGVPISVGGPIIIGGSVAIASISWARCFGRIG
ncbi:Uncharacterised protein [uncultured archaeon]|nr:Uncharacterised protein [uncultured archaeon]